VRVGQELAGQPQPLAVEILQCNVKGLFTRTKMIFLSYDPIRKASNFGRTTQLEKLLILVVRPN
jgi:hypothetical protein